jgi:hypothetical protein
MSVFLHPVTSATHLALVPEVQDALHVWKAMAKDTDWVLIGGLALSFYRKPRATQDVDVLLISESEVPSSVEGFKKVRPHTFRENGTHVEVELVTPALVDIPVSLVRKVFATARHEDGIKVASLEGMIALKLYGAFNIRRKHGDMADIIAMLQEHQKPVDMADWDLPDFLTPLYTECQSIAFL